MAAAVAVSAAIAVTVLTQLGRLRFTDEGFQAVAPHLAWVTTATCLLIAALALRGWQLALVGLALLGLTTATFVLFVLLPGLDVHVLPRGRMIASTGAGPIELVALQEHRGRTPHIALCEELHVIPGVRWTEPLLRVGPTGGVAFKRLSRNCYQCSFEAYEGRAPHPRVVSLRGGRY